MRGVRQLSSSGRKSESEMNCTPSYIKLLLAPLLVALLPPLCFAQNQPPASSGQVVVEIFTRYWGIGSGDACRRTLDFRLYADGRIEYEECQETEANPRRESLVRKESRVGMADSTEFVKLIEESKLLDKNVGRYPFHSGFNGVDTGWDTTMQFYRGEQEKKIEVKNYLPDSTFIPDWLHRIVKAAYELRGRK